MKEAKNETDSKVSPLEVRFTCEHCNHQFKYEFQTPLAVTCDHCGSLFDARLQLIKSFREEHDQITRKV